MKIIEIKALDNGAHRNQTGAIKTVPEGWAIIPDEITIPASFPFVDVKVKDGIVTSLTEGIVPAKLALTHSEINEMVVAKIREKYSVSEEFKMVNLGITDAENAEYVTYRNYVNECIAWGDALEKEQSAE